MKDKLPSSNVGVRAAQLNRSAGVHMGGDAMRIHAAFAACVILLLAGCITAPRNYVPAGFNSSGEARPYVSDYLYFASKLTPAEWNAFYGRFPEYFRDIQTAKQIGSTTEYHPWYVAYAFRWTTLQKRDGWTPPLVARLERGESSLGDDVFQLVYAKGPPTRLIWDNDAEVLLYTDDTAFVMGASQVSRIESCRSCTKRDGGSGSRWTMSTDQVLETLGIKRPIYSVLRCTGSSAAMPNNALQATCEDARA